MKVNNPILDITKPIKCSTSEEYNRIAKILNARGYKLGTGEFSLLKKQPPYNPPNYLYCYPNKVVLIDKELHELDLNRKF